MTESLYPKHATAHVAELRLRPFSDAQLVDLLQTIVRNDTTVYEHHQPRRFDGLLPEGGTIWLTPREMARHALQYLGAPVPQWGEKPAGGGR